MIMIDVSGGFVNKGRMIFMFGNKLEKIEKLRQRAMLPRLPNM